MGEKYRSDYKGCNQINQTIKGKGSNPLQFDIIRNNIFPAQAVDGNAAEGGFGSWQCLLDAPFTGRLHVLSGLELICRFESNDVIIFENTAATLLFFLVIPYLAP